jgi:hypothetical protein
MSQPRPAAMGHASGNIGAMKLLMSLWFFRSSGPRQKKIPAAPRLEEGYCPFVAGIPLRLPARYMRGGISPVT